LYRFCCLSSWSFGSDSHPRGHVSPTKKIHLSELVLYTVLLDRHYPNPALTRFFVVRGECQFQKISTIENTNSHKVIARYCIPKKRHTLFLPTMREDRIAVHARAVNLARRYTAQNENDLMQVCVSRMLHAINKNKQDRVAHFLLGFVCPL
jgi:hypothetical protein